MKPSANQPPSSPSPLTSPPRAAGIFAGVAQNKPEATLVILGLVTLIVAQFIQGFPPAAQQWVPGVLGLGGIMVLVGVQATYAKRLPAWVARPLQGVGQRLGVHESQVIFLVVGVLYAVLAARTIDFGPKLRAPFITYSIWGLGIGSVWLAGWREEANRWPSRRVWGITGGVTLLALLTRGVFTAQYPPFLTSDEASMGLNAMAFVKGETNNLFNVGWYSFPALFYYLESFSLWLLGQNMEALRVFSALAGALTVGGTYLVGRMLFGARAALVGALFLVGFHFHIHFSRLGLNNVWDGLVFIVVIGGLWAGWQNGKRVYFLIAGVALGLSIYLYASARLLFVLIPAWVFVAGILDRARLRRALPGLFWMGAVAFVVAAPLGWFYFNNPNEFLAPMRRVAIDGAWIAGNAQRTGTSAWWVVLRQIFLGLQAYVRENLVGFYLPETPMLRPLAGGVFLAGLALLSLHARETRAWLVFLWLVGFGMMTGITHEPTAAQRFVAAAPAVALLIGFALHELTQVLSELMPQARTVLTGLIFAGVVWMAVDDVRFYFWDFAPRAQALYDTNWVANDLAHHFAAQPENTQVFFYGAPQMGFYSHASMPFLAPHVVGHDVTIPPKPPITGSVVFVFLPAYQAVLTEVQQLYPGGTLREVHTDEGVLLYTRYEGTW